MSWFSSLRPDARPCRSKLTSSSFCAFSSSVSGFSSSVDSSNSVCPLLVEWYDANAWFRNSSVSRDKEAVSIDKRSKSRGGRNRHHSLPHSEHFRLWIVVNSVSCQHEPPAQR